ncbi:MAG: hypothetical protein IK093_11395 [Ruminiclostridium sp.]|nr:hypothetical protein [Ruminiclostridium sp.]
MELTAGVITVIAGIASAGVILLFWVIFFIVTGHKMRKILSRNSRNERNSGR